MRVSKFSGNLISFLLISTNEVFISLSGYVKPYKVMGEWNSIEISTFPDGIKGSVYEIVVNGEQIVSEKNSNPVSYRAITIHATREDYQIPVEN